MNSNDAHLWIADKIIAGYENGNGEWFFLKFDDEMVLGLRWYYKKKGVILMDFYGIRNIWF